MEMQDILKQMNDIFCEVLNDSSIVLTLETTAADVEQWDSLSHIRLITEVECHFNIKFKLREILKMKNVGDLCAGVQKKVK